jgi:signal transduction histidine kinase
MNKKLLHKTQRIYLYILIVLFAVIAPLFYFFIQKLYLNEIDETLMLSKSEFLDKSISELTVKDISVWNKFNSRIQIQQPKKIFKDTLFNQQYYNQLELENEPYRELNSPINIEGKSYTLSIKTSLLEADDMITGVALFFVIILIILFTAILFINKLLSVRMWKPFYQTLQQIENFEIDKHQQTDLPDSDIIEFNQLNKSVGNLIERSIAIYNNQREFVENAAHELQTPIAVFKAKLDTLIQRSDVSKEQSVIFGSLNESVSRLTRLNKNLLLLSKIENENYNDKQSIVLNEIIEKQLAFFTEQSDSKGISLKTELSKQVIIQSNPTLAEILISNLFMNAIRHNINNGQIWIKLTENSIVFSNTGNSKPLNKEKLFSRFSKVNPSGKGNGLGLAIVKKVCNLNNWQVAYTFSEEKHIFSILLH